MRLPNFNNLLGDIKRVKDVAVSGLADNIWNNERVVNNAKTIKEILGGSYGVVTDFLGNQPVLGAPTTGKEEAQWSWGKTQRFIKESQPKTAEEAAAVGMIMIGDTPIDVTGVAGIESVGKEVAGDLLAPAKAVIKKAAGAVDAELAEVGAKIRGSKPVSSLMDDFADLAEYFSNSKNKSFKDIVAERPDIQLRESVPAKNIHGEKITIPEGETLTPYVLKDGKVLLQDGITYEVSRNQYANIEGHSDIGAAVEFAPELKGTTDIVRSDASGPLGVKFQEQVIPGGKNYREILIRDTGESLDSISQEMYKVPYEDLAKDEMAIVNSAMPKGGMLAGNFQGTHFTEWNTIAHMRVNERAYNGQKVLFGEEFQSDWMRAARSAAKVGEDFKGHPLLDEWVKLDAQRFLKEAVDTKAGYAAWTTGEQQASRYGLQKKLNGINWEQGPEVKTIWMEQKDGNAVSFDVIGDKIVLAGGGVPEEWVGKSVADAVGEGVAEKIAANESGSLVGDQLNIGGEWARNLYDKQFKNVVEDLTGGKVKKIDMDLPVGKGEFIATTPDELGNYHPFTADKLKPGLRINMQSTADPTDVEAIVTQVMGDGKFMWVPESDVFYLMPDDTLEKGFKIVMVDGERFAYDPAWQTAESLTVDKSPFQWAIELTDKIKAKIRGESPVQKKVKKKKVI